MSRTIKYDSRGIAHIYQRGINMSVIFYSIKDILVFYTVLYTKKNKYDIAVLGVVCMYNHYHLTLTAGSHDDVADFQREFESTYAREFNSEVGIKGRVFEPVYGSFETMLIAFDSNTGSEHDISEEYSDKSYKPYPTLIHSLIDGYGFTNPKEVLKLSYEERLKMCNSLIRTQHVSPFIAGTLLHVYHPKPKRRKRRE